MDINDKFEKVLELQEQGLHRTEIYKICGWKRLDTLTRTMRKRGYVYDKKQEKYIQMTDVGQLPPTNKPSKTKKHQEVVKANSSTMLDLENDVLKNNILGLAKSYDEIMGLLEWYKTSGGQVSSIDAEVIEVVQQGIQIDLPKIESIKTSIRVNKEIWQQFGKFAELHSEFVKGDLLAQALKEYMEKYQ